MSGVRIHSDNVRPEDTQWWTFTEPDARGKAAHAAARRVDTATSARQREYVEAYALYGDASMLGGLVQHVPVNRRLSHNIIANVTDSFVAEVTQTEVRPMAEVDGGSYAERATGKKLQHHWDWLMEVAGQQEIAPQVVRDGAITGIGIERPYIDWQSQAVRFERIYPGHLLVDDRGLVDVDPTDIYVVRAVPKDRLERLYVHDDDPRAEEKREAIRNAGPPGTTAFSGDTWTNEVAGVVEGYYVGRGEGSYTISVDGYELDGGAYPYRKFPFAIYRPLPPVGGYIGPSLVLRAAPSQLELNKLLRRQQDAMHVHGRPLIFIEDGGSDMATQIVNDVYTIVFVPRGVAPPTQYNPASMPNDVVQQIATLIGRVYEAFGMSQPHVMGQAPANLQSGRAIRLNRDLTSRKFITAERGVGRLYCDMARLSVHRYRELDEREPVQTHYRRWGSVKAIEWSKLHIDDERLRVTIMPANALSKTPAAKQEELSEMRDAGDIPPDEYQLQADLTQLEWARSEITAGRDLLKQTFSELLEDGPDADVVWPTPNHPLELAIQLGNQFVLMGYRDRAPEEHIEAVREWMRQAHALLKRKAAEEAAAAPMAPPMPPDPAMMPPDPAMMPPGAPMPPMPPEAMGPDGMPPGGMPPGGMPPIN